jgi:transcriptional antiterminator NusG
MTTITKTNNYNWYALYTGYNQEKGVKDALMRKAESEGYSNSIETIVIPVEKYISKKNGVSETKERVLLPCYIFVKMDISNGELIPLIRSVKGFIGFINPSDGKQKRYPEKINERDIERFINLNDEKNNITDNNIVYHIGDRVKIIDGAFNTMVATIENIDNHKKEVSVSIMIFGRETKMVLSVEQIENIK